MQAWAVVASNAPLELIEMATPEPTGTEVLIEVTHCGVCHSDLHFWEGGYDLGGGKRMLLKDRGVTLPRAVGHEILGRVAKLGPDATGVAVGDRRIVYPWLGCGACRWCKAEQDNLCPNQRSLGVVQNGGFASHVLVPHPRYLVDPGRRRPGHRGHVWMLRHHRAERDPQDDAAGARRPHSADRRRRARPTSRSVIARSSASISIPPSATRPWRPGRRRSSMVPRRTSLPRSKKPRANPSMPRSTWWADRRRLCSPTARSPRAARSSRSASSAANSRCRWSAW